MDGKRLDDLLRRVAVGRSRRDVLKWLTGGAAAGVGVVTSRTAIEAAPIPPGFCTHLGEPCGHGAKHFPCCKGEGLQCRKGECIARRKT